MSLTKEDLIAIKAVVQQEVVESEERMTKKMTGAIAESEERMKREIKVSETSIKAELTAEIRSVGADVARLNASLLAHTQNQPPWKHD